MSRTFLVGRQIFTVAMSRSAACCPSACRSSGSMRGLAHPHMHPDMHYIYKIDLYHVGVVAVPRSRGRAGVYPEVRCGSGVPRCSPMMAQIVDHIATPRGSS